MSEVSKPFAEVLDEVLEEYGYAIVNHPEASRASHIRTHKEPIITAVRSLVEDVIGEDEDLYFGKPHGINDNFKFDLSASSKNDLRTEQRNRLKAALEGEG